MLMKIIEDRIDKILKSINVDYEKIYNIFNTIGYKITYLSNWTEHTLDDWLEQYTNNDIYITDVPSIEMIQYLVEMSIIDRIYGDYENEDTYICNIKICNKDNKLVVDISDIEKMYDNYVSLYTEWKSTKLNSKTKNCTKELANRIFNIYGEEEFYKIQDIEFPYQNITYDECINEFNLLVNTNKSIKKASSIIKKFHKSIIYANRNGRLSPYNGWQEIKSDFNKFKRLYINRIIYSDFYKKNYQYMLRGIMNESIYRRGMDAGKIYPTVSYFKPTLAKYIINKYLNEFDTIFDPFSGYSGRLLGAMSLNKNYIGYDLSSITVSESNEIINFISSTLNKKYNVNIQCKNSINETGEFDCLFTCPPYDNIEEWIESNIEYHTCDDWIDICLNNFKCKKYVFVVDDNIIKYKKYITEEFENKSHLGKNKEYIIVIYNDKS